MTASLSDLCSTSSDDDNANGKIHAARKRPNSLVEESTDLSSESEDEESDLSESLAAFFASSCIGTLSSGINPDRIGL